MVGKINLKRKMGCTNKMIKSKKKLTGYRDIYNTKRNRM